MVLCIILIFRIQNHTQGRRGRLRRRSGNWRGHPRRAL